MKEIRVFVASANDVKAERDALKDILIKSNDVICKYGVTLLPEMWELKDVSFSEGLRPKQLEYNDALIASDIVFFIFGSRVGEHTYEEFKRACESVKNRENLKVYVYFKNIDLGNSGETTFDILHGALDIHCLREEISKRLQQVYGEFTTIAELQGYFEREILSIAVPLLVESHQLDSNLQNLIELYGKTEKPFQINNRDGIIEEAINSLFFLSEYNYKPQLDEDSFYKLCHEIISNARKGTIRAMSLMLKDEWDDSDEEKKFWKDNQEAVKRGVRLERIFVVDKDKAHRLKTNPQIKNHITLGETYGEYMHSYVVEREDLQNKAPRLLEQARNGFILIESQQDKIALLDEIAEFGQRAKPVLNIQELNVISKVFENIKEFSMPLKDYLSNIAWSHHKKEMISIFVTTKCNLNCDYCFTNKNDCKHKDQTISLDFVKKGIDDYFFKTDFMRHVRFFGAGEPTVEFELIKKIHAYARKKGGDAVTFEIQTNGAFSDSIALWLKENIDIIWISCDGTPDIQDRHRPFLNDTRKTSAVIEKNIRILQGAYSNAFVGIRATITNENVNRQKEMVDYFYGLGIKDIWVDPIFPSVGDKPLLNVNDFDTMLFAKEFLEVARYAYEKGVFYGSILTCNFNDTVNKHCRACLPVPHLTTDGYVSACDMALFGKDENHMFPLIYGKWDEAKGEIKYDEGQKKYIQKRTTEHLAHCEMCEAKEHCGGYCLGEVLNETGNLFGCKAGICESIRYLNENLDSEIRKYKYTHP